MNIPQGAVIEIIERLQPGQDPAKVGAIVPNEIRVNGQRLLITEDGVTVHEMKVGSDFALVTLTLIAKRVVIGAEASDVPVTRDAVGNIVHVGRA